MDSDGQIAHMIRGIKMVKSIGTIETFTRDILLCRFDASSDCWTSLGFTYSIYVKVLKDNTRDERTAREVDVYDRFFKSYVRIHTESMVPLVVYVDLHSHNRHSVYAILNSMINDYRRVSTSAVTLNDLLSYDYTISTDDAMDCLAYYKYFVRCVVNSIFHLCVSDACTGLFPILSSVFITRERDYINDTRVHVCSNILKPLKQMLVNSSQGYTEGQRREVLANRQHMFTLLDVLDSIDRVMYRMYTYNKYDVHSVDTIVSRLESYRLHHTVPYVRERGAGRGKRRDIHSSIRERYA